MEDTDDNRRTQSRIRIRIRESEVRSCGSGSEPKCHGSAARLFSTDIFTMQYFSNRSGSRSGNNPGQQSNVQILSGHNGTAATLWKHIKDFPRKYSVCNQRRTGPLWRKFAKIYRVFLSKSLDPDPYPYPTWSKNSGSFQLHNTVSICAYKSTMVPQGADSHPPSSMWGKAGRNRFERGNYPLAPHLDRRVIQPNHIKFRTCSALAPMWTPL